MTCEDSSTTIAWVYYYAGGLEEATLIPEGHWGELPTEHNHRDIALYQDQPVGDSTRLQWQIDDCVVAVDNMQLALNNLSAGLLSDAQLIDYARGLINNQRTNPDSPFYGAWRVIPGDDKKIPADARVDFIYTPTYIAVAFLCRLSLEHPAAAKQLAGLRQAIHHGMAFATGRNLSGAGYDRTGGLVNACRY